MNGMAPRLNPNVGKTQKNDDDGAARVCAIHNKTPNGYKQVSLVINVGFSPGGSISGCCRGCCRR